MGILSEEQKQDLRDPYQEHLLLLNEEGDLELHPYHQIEEIAGKSSEIRAFIFDRNNVPWVVYWHISGEGSINLPVNAEKISLFEEPGIEIPVSASNGNITLPAGNRRYIQFNMTEEEVLDLFANSSIL